MKNREIKVCETCRRPFEWRKKWERDWKNVLYCSKLFCRNCWDNMKCKCKEPNCKGWQGEELMCSACSELHHNCCKVCGDETYQNCWCGNAVCNHCEGYLYEGCVDCRNGDFLAMDVHEWHCNTKIIPLSKDYTRLSLVAYLRERMIKCKNMTPN